MKNRIFFTPPGPAYPSTLLILFFLSFSEFGEMAGDCIQNFDVLATDLNGQLHIELSKSRLGTWIIRNLAL